MSPRQDRQLVVQAVLMALWQRLGCIPVILVLGSDCQFTTDAYQWFLESHQLICSMSAMRSCADNVVARADSFDFLERCHNPRQRRRLNMQQ